MLYMPGVTPLPLQACDAGVCTAACVLAAGLHCFRPELHLVCSRAAGLVCWFCRACPRLDAMAQQQVGGFGGDMFPEDGDGQRRGQVEGLTPGTHSPPRIPAAAARLSFWAEARAGED